MSFWCSFVLVWAVLSVPGMARAQGPAPAQEAGAGATATAWGVGLAGERIPPAAREGAARRAAIADAQRRLLEIVQGTTLFAGVETGDAMRTNDVIRSRVSGMLVGAVVVGGSEVWDPNDGTYRILMMVPLGNVHRSLPRMRLAADGETLLVLDDSSPGAGIARSAASEPTFDAVDDAYQVSYGGAVDLDVLTNDTGDRSSFSLQVVRGVDHGTLVAGERGTLLYRHDGATEGVDGFTYELVDATGASRTATVILAIGPAPAPDEEVAAQDAPVAPAPDPLGLDEGPASGDPSVAAEPSGGDAPRTSGSEANVPTASGDEASDPEVMGPATRGEAVNGGEAAADASLSDPPVDPPAEPPAIGGAIAEGAPPPPAPVPQPDAVGGPIEPIEPIRGPLPSVVVLDATGLPTERPFALHIKSSSGEFVYDTATPYYAQPAEVASRGDAEVLRVREVTPDGSIVLDEQQAERLRRLLAQRDYVQDGGLWIAGGG